MWCRCASLRGERWHQGSRASRCQRLVDRCLQRARFGNPLDFGYADEGFTMPFLGGAHMLLLEPSKSLVSSLL